LSGKTAAMVKTCLAYIGSKIYSPKHVLNCGTITSFYGIKSKQYVYNNYENYLLNLEQGKPETLKLDRRKLTPKTYRDRADIMADFLTAAACGAKKTKIMEEARLTHDSWKYT
jgi:hypothetical protein